MKKTSITGMKTLALLASGMAAVAPSSPNAPAAPNGGTAISQGQVQQGQGMQASQSQAVAGAQQGIMPTSRGGSYHKAYSDWSTFPAYNQRKARKASRQAGNWPIKKRYV